MITSALRNVVILRAWTLANALDDTSRRVFRSIEDFPMDDNDKLDTHLFLYPEGHCADLFDQQMHGDLFLREYHPIDPGLQKLFGFSKIVTKDEAVSDFQECPATCVELGVDKSVVTSPMPNFYYDGISNVEDFITSHCDNVEIGFLQYTLHPVNVYWINHEGERVFTVKITHGERGTKFIHSYLGHAFAFEDDVTKETLLTYKVRHTGLVRLGHHDNGPPYFRDIDKEVRSTHEHEWRRHQRVTRTFSPLGFQKGRLPDDLWGSIGAYYYNNQYAVTSEEWSGKGIFVNWWENDVKFVQVPWNLKTVWQTRLRRMVEVWTGIELENTDMYGMRQYESGARLLSHVDRESTHAASLIINVAQTNVTKPWTVEVHDHADRLHEVVMTPGDVVYYESAKCLHGRNTPLEGDVYVNLFAHYRPVGDDEWYRRENPEWSPGPLLDVGECSLVGDPDQYSQSAVKCDNPAIGPHLSPTMFVANSGNDLYQWWKRVSPKIEQDVMSVAHDEL